MSLPVHLWLVSFVPISVLALLAWVVCTLRRNVGLVDIAWPLFLLAAGLADAWLSPAFGVTGAAQLALLLLWALRLAAHLARRNWRAPEDRRYVAIRARNEPGFWWKSLFIVFLLQAVLAWIISLPLAVGATARSGTTPALLAGLLLALFGLAWEAIADQQLTRFRRQPSSAGQVLDTGLWRYSRHPNYFGECLVWWGLFLTSATLAAPWTVVSPLLMTVLLLRVSGVSLLEQDIGQRRPGYAAYVASTPAFFPRPLRGPR